MSPEEFKKFIEETEELAEKNLSKLSARKISQLGTNRYKPQPPSPKYTCPCKLADEPCSKHCTCINPFSSHGCCCCATYGDEEQRKATANFIVKLLRR